MAVSEDRDAILPFTLCAGVGSEAVALGEVANLLGISAVESYRVWEGLCGVRGWSECISLDDLDIEEVVEIRTVRKRRSLP